LTGKGTKASAKRMRKAARVCYSGPRGLADALIQPCGCRGTQALVHVSCLHAWRTQRAVQLQDSSRCEVCGVPYQVPLAAWRAYAASAEAGGALRLRLQTLCQRAAAPLGRAVTVTLLLAHAVVRARHLWHWLGQVGVQREGREDCCMFGYQEARCCQPSMI
jgi:E3 ubiquitin-protein ligase DOA10